MMPWSKSHRVLSIVSLACSNTVMHTSMRGLVLNTILTCCDEISAKWTRLCHHFFTLIFNVSLNSVHGELVISIFQLNNVASLVTFAVWMWRRVDSNAGLAGWLRMFIVKAGWTGHETTGWLNIMHTDRQRPTQENRKHVENKQRQSTNWIHWVNNPGNLTTLSLLKHYPDIQDSF